MKSTAPLVDLLIRDVQPAPQRVAVFTHDDAWVLAFRSLVGRPGFEVPPTIVDWIPPPTASVNNEDSAANAGESWLARSLQPRPNIMVWDTDSLRVPRIARVLRRCDAVAPLSAHVVVGRFLTPKCRMNWTALGVTATIGNSADLWSQRRLIQRMLERTVDCAGQSFV